MSNQQLLQGSCSCGRYKYSVVIPGGAQDQAQVHFRTDDEHRRSQAALLTAFLRVPLAWYSSNIISYFPDETHNSISRTFSPVEEPHSQRKFCGFCGTHLSYWTEDPREEQDYLHITVGSLRKRDLDTLQDLDLVPEDAVTHGTRDQPIARPSENEPSAVVTSQSDDAVRTVRHGQAGSMTWFEEMLDGSQLGRTRKSRRGMGTSADGTTSVSWEITEYTDDGDNDVVMTTSSNSGAKRKIGDVADESGS